MCCTEVFEVTEQVEKHFGRIDVLINNVDFGLFGTTEETTEQQAREQIETNFFVSLWVAQTVLTVMRKQKKIYYLDCIGQMNFQNLYYNVVNYFIVQFSDDEVFTQNLLESDIQDNFPNYIYIDREATKRNLGWFYFFIYQCLCRML